MKKAKVFSDKHYPIGKIDDKIYASFTEHLGRCIYSGLYENRAIRRPTKTAFVRTWLGSSRN